MKFSTYHIGPSPTSGWYWQVVKPVGPTALVVARSGIGYTTEKAAMDAYKEFVAWASNPSSPA